MDSRIRQWVTSLAGAGRHIDVAGSQLDTYNRKHAVEALTYFYPLSTGKRCVASRCCSNSFRTRHARNSQAGPSMPISAIRHLRRNGQKAARAFAFNQHQQSTNSKSDIKETRLIGKIGSYNSWQGIPNLSWMASSHPSAAGLVVLSMGKVLK